MFKSDILNIPLNFEGYINEAYNENIHDALKKSLSEITKLDINILEKIADKSYAAGKWTVKDILQHLIDAERVFTYRALRFSRMDETALHGFEENDFAANAEASRRSIRDLVKELTTLRINTIQLFLSFTDNMLMAEGIANGNKMTTLAIGFCIVGHQVHHFNVLTKLYFPLA